MMLAVYLTTPEIENDRRALNVKQGMRQARKEGRWMGVAPIGYINKTNEDGRKYVALSEPQATHMRWAFEMIAEGIYATEEIWKMAKARGLTCSRNSFWTAIRNVGYCGKVLVPEYKNEVVRLVKGLHQPLISETLFYKVQDILDGRKRDIGINSKKGIIITSPERLPLRGFLLCTICTRILTGSASKGRNGYHYYYHCSSACGWRQNADKVNTSFVIQLRKFIPKPGMSELFKEIVSDLYKDTGKHRQEERKKIISEVTENNNRITKARELLLKDNIDPEDYKLIKKESEEKILRLEAKLADFNSPSILSINIEGLIDKAVENLKKLDLLYINGDIEAKRKIIGSIFPEKWTFDGTEHRTGQANKAASLIYQIHSSLSNKKNRIRTNMRTESGLVPSAGVEPARFPTGV